MNKQLKRFFDYVEGYLFYFTICFIILLVVIQAVMVRDDVRQYLSRVDMLEGEPYFYVIEDEEDGDLSERPAGEFTDSYLSLTLKISPPEARLTVLVNGAERGVLQDRPLTVSVEAGDLIEVEGETGGDPAIVIISDTEGLKQPGIGEEITVFGENELIGWAVPEE